MLELAGYETLELIGGGGFGDVWLACQNSTGRNVAVKVAHAPISDATLQIRFEREYKALGRLSGHPNIVDIVTAGTLSDGRAYLVLEYIEGGTLWDRAQSGRLEEGHLIAIGLELAQALKAAHMAGVLHRDIKPENVLLREGGEAVLGDFGLAQLQDGATTSPNGVIASVAYAAPEILQGDGASAATDLYGIGACLLTAAMRSVPFVEAQDKSIQTVIQRVMTDSPPDISELGYSGMLKSVVEDLMAKDPRYRPATAVDVVRRLQELPTSVDEQDSLWSDLLGESETESNAANESSLGDTPEKYAKESLAANKKQAAADVPPEPPQSSNFWWSPDDGPEPVSETRQEGGTAPATTEPDAQEQPHRRITPSGTSSATRAEDTKMQHFTTRSSETDNGYVPAIKPDDQPPEVGAFETASTGETHERHGGMTLSSEKGPHPELDDVDQLIRELTTTAERQRSRQTPAQDDPPLGTEPEAPASGVVEAVGGTTGDNTGSDGAGSHAADEATSHSDASAIKKTTHSSDNKASSAEAQPHAGTEDLQPEPSSGTAGDSAPVAPMELPTADATMELPALSLDEPPSPPQNAAPTTSPEPSVASYKGVDKDPAESFKSEAKDPARKTPKQHTGGLRKDQKKTANRRPDKTANKRKRNLLAGIAILAGLGFLIGFFFLTTPQPDSANAQDQVRPADSDPNPVLLPLSLNNSGFADGTVEATTPSLGPTTPLFCNNSIASEGLTRWKGSQFLVPDDKGSIEQLVANFANPSTAAAYVSQIDSSLNCETWSRSSQGTNYAVNAARIEPATSFGEQTTEYKTSSATAAGETTFGYIYVTLQDSSVLILTLNAKKQDDVDALSSVADEAGKKFTDAEN